MVQTLRSEWVSAIAKRIVFEKPRVLQRIFLGVYLVEYNTSGHDVKLSFGDPQFHSFFTLDGPVKQFEARGADIFQGDVWIANLSQATLLYSATQILSE